MTLVYSCESLLLAHHMKNLLENQQINCEIRNQAIQGGLGDIPPTEAWPQVWILDQDQLAAAEQIVKQAKQPLDESLPEWHCQQCGETNEGQFHLCWQCSEPQNIN